MATDKPKLQGYVEQGLFDRFTQWKRELGIEKDSAALNQLLKEFFGAPSLQAQAVEHDQGEIEAIIEAKLADLKKELPNRDDLRVEVQEQIYRDKRQFIESLKLEAQSIISVTGDEMKKAIAQIEARLQSIESNPSGGLPSDTALISDMADTLHGLESRIEALESGLLSGANGQESPGDRLAADASINSGLNACEEAIPATETLSMYSAARRLLGESPVLSLSGAELARRLKVDPATLVKNRKKASFEQWSREKDPQGFEWRYCLDVKRYEVKRKSGTEAPGADFVNGNQIAEAPGEGKRYSYQNRPKVDDCIFSGYNGKAGQITRIHSDQPEYEVTWDDGKKARHSWDDFAPKCLNVTYVERLTTDN